MISTPGTERGSISFSPAYSAPYSKYIISRESIKFILVFTLFIICKYSKRLHNEHTV